MGGVGGVASHTSAHHAEVLNELDPKQGNGGNGVMGGLHILIFVVVGICGCQRLHSLLSLYFNSAGLNS